ncbi:MAG: signal peptidase I [Verrucomicrobia bacterium]|nr:signal peptidase I [Verrucomicrobiota bacterium]
MTTKHILREARVQVRRYRRRLSDEVRREIEKDIEKLDAARKERRKTEAHEIAKALLKKMRAHTPKTIWHHTIETVESFVIAIIVALAIRHLVVEPFKIPTGSMEPTLHGSSAGNENPKRIGDFIMVSKFAYGPKIPFTRSRLWTTKPKRWDIVVFSTKGINTPDGRPAASDPARNFVKRVIGLPGETIEVRDGWIYANGEKAEMPEYLEQRLTEETGREYPYQIWKRPDEDGNGFGTPVAGYDRVSYKIDVFGIRLFAEKTERVVLGPWPYGWDREPFKVPEGHYFMMGDNTDHSLDSRAWGFVPFENIKGRVLCVWYPVYRWRVVK